MDLKLNKEMIERRAARKNLVKTADRSEKIRTYNFPQVRSNYTVGTTSDVSLKDRVTDHRIGLTLKNLSAVMNGDGLQDFTDALTKNHDETGKLSSIYNDTRLSNIMQC